MSASSAPATAAENPLAGADALLERFGAIRKESENICAPLAIEDYVVQSATEVSPPKWHLAHTSWFFETFLLQPFLPGYPLFHPQYGYLFNSYYQTVGCMHPRPERGLLSRPTVEEVYDYRSHVDRHMTRLLESIESRTRDDVLLRAEVGLHHEQQHQELLYTDIKHILGCNPLRPGYRKLPEPKRLAAPPQRWLDYEGGMFSLGHEGDGFAFDNETPAHQVIWPPSGSPPARSPTASSSSSWRPGATAVPSTGCPTDGKRSATWAGRPPSIGNREANAGGT